jgi:predicted TPR repeat methyltransferase
MAAGGLFVFTVETAAPGQKWCLRSSGRYAHGDGYIVETLTRHGLRLLAKRSFAVRQEAGQPLDGAVYLAVKPTPDGAPT